MVHGLSLIIRGKMTKSLTISNLSKQASVKVSTIRYYQKIGLFPVPPKNQSGYHDYSNEHLELLKFIKQTQKFGFSLVEIKEIISTKSKLGAQCSEMKNIVDLKIEELSKQIQELSNIKTDLAKLSYTCLENTSIDNCPIIGTFKNE